MNNLVSVNFIEPEEEKEELSKCYGKHSYRRWDSCIYIFPSMVLLNSEEERKNYETLVKTGGNDITFTF